MRELGIRAWRNRFGNIFPREGDYCIDKHGYSWRVLEVYLNRVVISLERD